MQVVRLVDYLQTARLAGRVGPSRLEETPLSKDVFVDEYVAFCSGNPWPSPTPHRSACHAGVTGWADGCRCDECIDGADDARGLLERYLDGERAARIAAEMDVTSSRVWQVFALLMPPQQIKETRKHRRDMRQAEQAAWEEEERRRAAERENVTCQTCGRPHHRKTGGRSSLKSGNGPSWSANCSSECSVMWGEVRFLTEESHALQIQRCADWAARNPDSDWVNESQLRSAQRRLSGEGPTYDDRAWSRRKKKRWLIPGSKRHDIAHKAYRESWPAFSTWPQDIQDQIMAEVAELADSA